jgi:uncharacterized membrane protein YqgA involved in biofilm formation
MLGTIVNVIAIICGSLLGLLFRKGIPDNYKEIIMSGIGLSVLLIGVKSALSSDQLLVVIFSVIIGAAIGEFLRIEAKLESLGGYIEHRLAGRSGDTASFTRGFVTASLVFCVGSMAIVGSLESGLTGNHQTLYAKSILDGVTSLIFASTLGVGVIFSGAAVFLYQGAITMTAVVMKNFLVAETISQMTSVGGLLILAIGLNLLGLTQIRVGNLLPGIFLPLLYFAIRSLFS